MTKNDELIQIDEGDKLIFRTAHHLSNEQAEALQAAFRDCSHRHLLISSELEIIGIIKKQRPSVENE
jgi:hypothetical protein